MNREERIKKLIKTIDITVKCLYKESITLSEAVELIEDIKKICLYLLPENEKIFDIVLLPRFDNLLCIRRLLKPDETIASMLKCDCKNEK